MRLRLPIAALFCAVTSIALAGPTTLPSGPIPDGLGVNIHFTDPQPGELQMMSDAGFTMVRMDFVWDRTERQPGVYDFSAYDRLFAALDEHHIRPLFILDYANPLYDDDLAPHTDAGRAAMAKWTAAAVTHFKGRGAIWEMWNEPNIGFWKPSPNVSDYAKLALEVARAIRGVAPDETLIGPGVSGIDLTFLEACFKAGLLEQWDAVSVHPYRQSAPETAASDYAKLRDLIERYAPKGRTIPILSGEWGYSSAWAGFDEEQQGDHLARQWLTNLEQGVPISIWYDWHDDGTDPKEPEHHFGTVRHEPRPTTKGQPLFEPKPAYLAAKTLTQQLRGLRFNKRLDVQQTDARYPIHLLLFTNDAGDEQRLALWSEGGDQQAWLPSAMVDVFDRVDHLGRAQPPVQPGATNFRNPITVTRSAQYLTRRGGPSDLMRIAAAWERLPLLIRDRTRASLPIATTLRNPLDRPITIEGGDLERQTLEPGETRVIRFTVRPPRAMEPVRVPVALNVVGLGSVQQSTSFVSLNPRRIMIEPSVAGPWSARIENPAGEAFAGTMTVSGSGAADKSRPIRFGQGEREHRVPLDVEEDPQGRLKVSIKLRDADDAPPLQLAAQTFARLGGPVVANGRVTPGYAAAAEGDERVNATTSLAIAAGPTPNTQSIELRYHFDAGWKFAVVRPPEAARAIQGKPSALLIWVWSDGSGVAPRLRFTDAGNETFQPNGEALTTTGWRLLRFPLDGSDHPGHWGGDGNGKIDYPIRIESLLLLDNVARAPLTGTARFAAPVLVYP